MRAGGRLAAAIEILDDLDKSKRPAPDAIKAWGSAHRFAGSTDRSATANLVYDALRRRSSMAFRMHSDTNRAIALGALRWAWDWSIEDIMSAARDPEHGAGALTSDEAWALNAALPENMPGHIAADIPEWLWSAARRCFGNHAISEGMAMAARAPLDLRVNSLKTDRETAFKALAKLSPELTPYAPLGLRLRASQPDRRAPDIDHHAVGLKGWVEVQDEGSQLAATMCAVQPGQLVFDLCAGSGGKTLALAAAMQNKGQIFAFDSDARRLAPIRPRLQKAGVRNAQVLPAHDPEKIGEWNSKIDLVVIDAPCTGSGTWRRRPDAKWRLKPEALAERQVTQAELLQRAARLVRPGGRIAYITCSFLPEENEATIAQFLKNETRFDALAASRILSDAFGTERSEGLRNQIYPRPFGLQMSPFLTRTDGFYVSILVRQR